MEKQGIVSEAKIVDYIKKYGCVTFAELSRAFDDTEGVWALEGGKESVNVIFWVGMSERFLRSVKVLLDSEYIEMSPASPMAYFMDGQILKMPLVKSTRVIYKKAHWLPVYLKVKKGRK